MTIALVSTVQTAAATSPVNHSAISGVAAGNLYLDFCVNNADSTVPSLDSTYAFTSIESGSTEYGAVFGGFNLGYRVASGAESALDASASGKPLSNIFFALSGVDPTTPIESYQRGDTYAHGGSGNEDCPASTSTVDNAWHVIVFTSMDATNSTYVSGLEDYTQLGVAGPSGSNYLYVFYKQLGAAGSTGVKSILLSADFNGLLSGFIVRPAASGPISYYLSDTVEM